MATVFSISAVSVVPEVITVAVGFHQPGVEVVATGRGGIATYNIATIGADLHAVGVRCRAAELLLLMRSIAAQRS